MKTFFCILALVYTAFASNEQYSLDVLLKQYEAMTGSSWSDAAADIDIPVEDEDDSIDGDDNDDDDDDSDSKDVKNLPEYNGHDIIGETGRQSGTHFVWKTEDYEPLVHSFAKDGIDCEDLETCEIHCTGEYGCYATEINGNSAKKVILNCSGENSCQELQFTMDGAANVEIICTGSGSCNQLEVVTTDVNLNITCDTQDDDAKKGACENMYINYRAAADMPDVVNQDGSLTLECMDSPLSAGSCYGIKATCPKGADTCSITCGENACRGGFLVFMGSTKDGDDVDLTCAAQKDACEQMYLMCVDDDNASTHLAYDIPDGGSFVTAKEWICPDDKCCPDGLKTA